jgi:hypothetical protein
VWISRRLIQENPSSLWWIEGDENRIRWAEVCGFYRAFDITNPIGGEDGFFEMERSWRNLALLQEVANR